MSHWDLNERFWRNGYAALDHFVIPEEVAGMAMYYDMLFDHGEGIFDFSTPGGVRGRGAPVLQILDPQRQQPAIRKMMFRDHARTLARHLLGSEARIVFEHAIYKPRLHGGVTPWHQDRAFFEKYVNYESISFWFPLQDVDETSGCMRFIPGSHLWPLLEHRSLGGDPRVHGLEVVDIACARGENPVTCPLPAGGVTIHHNMTLHMTGSNTSDFHRRAYIIGFGIPAPAQRHDYPWNAARKAFLTSRMGIVERARNIATDAVKALVRR